jgi:hypothetical protein
MPAYTPRTEARCTCRRGIERDNCPTCEGTGWVIDFARIHRERREIVANCAQCQAETPPPAFCLHQHGTTVHNRPTQSHQDERHGGEA